MEKIKQTADYTIFAKRSKRHAVKTRDGKWLNGEDKVKVLVEEKLVTLSEPKPAEPEPAEEDAAEGGEAETEAGTEEGGEG